MCNAAMYAVIFKLLFISNTSLFTFIFQVLTSSTSVPPVTTESALPDEVAIATQSCAVQSSWHLQFNIPELGTFSGAVKKAVKTGIVTSVARREIVQVLRTYMTLHTRKPTSEQYISLPKIDRKTFKLERHRRRQYICK